MAGANVSRNGSDDISGVDAVWLDPGRADGLDLLVGHLVDSETMGRAVKQAADNGTSPVAELIACGWITQHDYIEALSKAIGTATPHQLQPPAQHQPGQHQGGSHRLSPGQIRGPNSEILRRAHAQAATVRLERERPDLSAHRRHATWQLLLLPAVIGLTLSCLATSPETTTPVLALAVTLPFLAIVALRLVALVHLLAGGQPHQRMRRRRRPQAAAVRSRTVEDASLPVYTVLIPLYQEAEVLADVVSAMDRLDYPRGKLDVILVLEENDQATQQTAHALILPHWMRIVVVPMVGPQTKPKALNYAMGHARGAFVVVYDAEDEPEPDQLRLAVAAFRRGPPALACVQARLNIYNTADGFLTRQFTLEYAALFDALLPTLAALRLPVPLGGTSNHFPRHVVERLGLWDAYNVTEDADLGLRIARSGGRVAMLGSTTWEEAPPRWRYWLTQRTRWLKGFMQTWLVHTRRPARAIRELGLWGFLGFNIHLGGLVLSALLYPLLTGLVVVLAATGQFPANDHSNAGEMLVWLALFNLGVGHFAVMALAAAAAVRRGRYGLLPHVALMPIYWLAISLAAWRALWQLWRAPYLWEKTPHGPRRGRQARISRLSRAE